MQITDMIIDDLLMQYYNNPNLTVADVIRLAIQQGYDMAEREFIGDVSTEDFT